MSVYVPRIERDGKRRYGRWAGRPDGDKEDPKCCVVQVGGDRMSMHQCSRQRGYGPDKLFCHQHAKLVR
jgi:hypothetical protein